MSAVIMAPPEVVGKTCPYDQFPITVGQEVVICPSCATPHHADCWQENGGCTTYGCSQAPVSGPAAQAAAAPMAPPGRDYIPPWLPPDVRSEVGPAMAAMAMEVDRSATNALLVALLGIPCCGFPALIGFFMGVSVFAVLDRTRVYCPSARTKAIWAMVVGALAPLVWIGLVLVVGSMPGA